MEAKAYDVRRLTLLGEEKAGSAGNQAEEALVTVSGSFRRFMSAIQEAVYALTDLGAYVLSPADPRIVASSGEFLFVASDKLRLVRGVQDRHLAAIAASDILWLVAPDGYVGASGAMEIGFAAAVGTPVYSTTAPSDLTLKEYVQVVGDMKDGLAAARRTREHAGVESVILDPEGVIEFAHRDLDFIGRSLASPLPDARSIREAANRLKKRVARPLG